MNGTTRILTTAAATALAVMATHGSARAVPVFGTYVEDPRCDTINSQSLSHELGEVNFFPINEALQVQVSPATFTVCVPNDNIQNDWIVQITNVSGQAWQDLFFVADDGMFIGNADGTVIDITNAPQTKTDAFRIDSLGINANLLSETVLADNILQVGETWRFNVSNFTSFPGTPPFPVIMRTPGVFAGSDPIVIPPTNTASILATPAVPEPSTIGAVALVGAALALRRRPRRN